MELPIYNPLDNNIPTPKCSLCFNYLSHAGTVKLSIKKLSPICGRCLPSLEDSREQYVTSLYNEIVGFFTFKCINHFSGCRAVVTANSDHETNCPEHIASCPICAYVGNGCQLEYHFEECHKEFLIKARFTITNENGFISTFLYREKDTMFAVYVVIENDVLKIKAVNMLKHPKLNNYRIELSCNFVRSIYSDIGKFEEKKDIPAYLTVDLYKLTNHFTKPKIYGKIKVIDPDSNDFHMRNEIISIESSIKEIQDREAELDHEMEEVQDEYDQLTNAIAKIELSNSLELLQKFVGLVTPLMTVCSSCKMFVGSNYKICLNNHLVCSNCQKINECPSCGAGKRNQFRSAHPILDEFQLKCQWSGCDQTISIHRILSHKQACPMRLYTCPDLECNLALGYEEFIKHWHYTSPILEIGDCIGFLHKKHQQFYWMMPLMRELVHVKIKEISKNETYIRVDEQFTALNSNYELKLYGKVERTFKCIGSLKQHGSEKVIKYPHLQILYRIAVSAK